VCGIFSVGSVSAVIVRPNDPRGSRCQHHGEAGGDSGSDQKQRRRGYAGDTALELEGRADLRGVRGMDRHPAHQRYCDYRPCGFDHQLHTDLQRTRRVGLSVGRGRRDLARSYHDAVGVAADDRQRRHVHLELELGQRDRMYRLGRLAWRCGD
jgi:hypothetical protein